MTDTVLRGTGNSRTLRTVANAKTLYQTWDSALTAMINGTFPIDIGSLNSAGLTRRGTDLNKANILTDTTATGMGLTSSATPNDAFAKLSALVKAAQDDASMALDHGVLSQTGSYVGTGKVGTDNPNSLFFSIPWKVVFIAGVGTHNFGIISKGAYGGVAFSHSGQYMAAGSHIKITNETSNSLSWAFENEKGNAFLQLNYRDVTYKWIAFG